MTIAERLKAYRHRSPYPTLREVGKKVGLSATYLSDVERGLRIPRGATLDKLARFLGTTADSLDEEPARIVQISATAVNGKLRVACLLSDGTIRVEYPEGATI